MSRAYSCDEVAEVNPAVSVKASLNSIAQQLAGLPKEIQIIVEASIAVATLQTTSVDAAGNKPPSPSPAPAPDIDVPTAAATVNAQESHLADAAHAAAKTILATTKPAQPAPSQGKKTGASLLRKVSLGLAGIAGAPAGHPGVKVGGPRKMGATRLFGHPPAAAIAPDARNRWRADKYQSADAPEPVIDVADGVAPPMEDSHTHLLTALEGLPKELVVDDEANEDRQVLIAQG